MGVLLFLVLLRPPGLQGAAWPILGRDPLGSAALLENHSEALVRWARQGIRDAVLVNIDAHDDLRRISPEKIAALRGLTQKKDWLAVAAADSGGDQGLYHCGSFIYAACRLGMVRRVYWVIPFAYFQGPAPVRTLERFLASYSFAPASIDTFQMRAGVYQGIYHGIPLTLCSAAHLPTIGEPVILSIDADFFPPLARGRGQDVLTAMALFFDRLAEKQYRVRDALVAASINGGYLGVARRWIADHCLTYLARPEVRSRPYPPSWLIRNTADGYYQQDQTRALLDFTAHWCRERPRDSCLMAYRAFAVLAAGDRRGAMALATAVCRDNPRFAYLLADLGQCLLDRGALEAALPFFQKAYQAAPSMNFRQKNLADVLLAAGRYRQALAYYAAYRRLNGTFPAAFLMGFAAEQLGDHRQAGKWYAQGVEALGAQRYFFLNATADGEAVRRAVAYFRHRHDAAAIKIVMAHPRLRACLNGAGTPPQQVPRAIHSGR